MKQFRNSSQGASLSMLPALHHVGSRRSSWIAGAYLYYFNGVVIANREHAGMTPSERHRRIYDWWKELPDSGQVNTLSFPRNMKVEGSIEQRMERIKDADRFDRHCKELHGPTTLPTAIGDSQQSPRLRQIFRHLGSLI